MPVINQSISSFAAISALLMNWYVDIMIVGWYRAELPLFLSVSFCCIAVCMLVVFIRLYELEKRRLTGTTRVIGLSKLDLAVFLTGSVIFVIVTAYGVASVPHAPLSTISDLLQIISFVIAFLPFLKKAWQG